MTTSITDTGTTVCLYQQDQYFAHPTNRTDRPGVSTTLIRINHPHQHRIAYRLTVIAWLDDATERTTDMDELLIGITSSAAIRLAIQAHDTAADQLHKFIVDNLSQ